MTELFNTTIATMPRKPPRTAPTGIEVVHMMKHPNATYIGRKWAGREASPLGNPYHLTSENERSAVLAKYHQWLRAEYRKGASSAAYRELMRLVEQYNRVGFLLLGCWCKKEGIDVGCHGDVVKLAIEGIAKLPKPPTDYPTSNTRL